MNITQKINILTIDSLAELALVQQPPCLSLYQPTHRRHPENQQDQHQTVASYGGVGGGSRPMHHSQGGEKDEAGGGCFAIKCYGSLN